MNKLQYVCTSERRNVLASGREGANHEAVPLDPAGCSAFKRYAHVPRWQNESPTFVSKSTPMSLYVVTGICCTIQRTITQQTRTTTSGALLTVDNDHSLRTNSRTDKPIAIDCSVHLCDWQASHAGMSTVNGCQFVVFASIILAGWFAEFSPTQSLINPHFSQIYMYPPPKTVIDNVL